MPDLPDRRTDGFSFQRKDLRRALRFRLHVAESVIREARRPAFRPLSFQYVPIGRLRAPQIELIHRPVRFQAFGVSERHRRPAGAAHGQLCPPGEDDAEIVDGNGIRNPHRVADGHASRDLDRLVLLRDQRSGRLIRIDGKHPARLKIIDLAERAVPAVYQRLSARIVRFSPVNTLARYGRAREKPIHLTVRLDAVGSAVCKYKVNFADQLLHAVPAVSEHDARQILSRAVKIRHVVRIV